MKTLTANYTARNNLDNKTPVMVVSFSSITDEFFSTGNFLDSTAEYKQVIHDVIINFPTVNLSTCDIIGGSAEIVLIKSAEALAFIRNRLLYFDVVTIRAGFKEIALADFVTLFAGVVDAIEYDERSATFTLTAFDMTHIMGRPILAQQRRTRLASNLNATASSCDVDSVEGFPDAQNLFWPIGNDFDVVSMGIKIDNEIMSYKSTHSVSAPFLIGNMLRGLANTVGESHVAGADIELCMLFSCDPAATALFCLINSNAHTLAARTSFYDLGAPEVSGVWYTQIFMDDWMIGIPLENIDVFSIEKLGWRFFSASIDYGQTGATESGIFFKCSSVLFDKESSGTAFLSRLLTGTGIVLVPFSDLATGPRIKGISVDVLTLREAGTVYTFDASKIIFGGASYSPKLADFQNEITLLASFSGQTDDFIQKKTFVQDDSVSVYRKSHTRKEIINGGLSVPSPAQIAPHDLIMRKLMVANLHTAELASAIKLAGTWANIAVEIGDFVDVDYNKLELPRTSAELPRGIVTSQKLSFRSCRIDYELTSFNIFDKLISLVDSPYSIVKIPESSITKKAATVNPTIAVGVQAEDAYYDNSSGHVANVYVVHIRVTPPASPAGQEGVLDIGAAALTSLPLQICGHNARTVRLKVGDPAREFDFYMVSATTDAAARVKLDFFRHSFTNAPTVELIGIWFVNFSAVYSWRETV